MFKPKILLVLVAVLVSASSSLATNGYVMDSARALNPRVSHQLSALATELEQKTGVQAVLMVVPSIGGYTIDEYASRRFEALGIGKKGADEGVLFVTAIKERKTRIEVGYGLEGILTDQKTGAILDTAVIPHFQNHQMEAGLVNGYLAILGVISKAKGVTLNGAAIQQTQAQKGGLGLVEVIVLILCISFFIGGGRRSGLLPWLVLGSMMGGGRSSFGGFGGGGFGGFGGGLSGGGGASRGW